MEKPLNEIFREFEQKVKSLYPETSVTACIHHLPIELAADYELQKSHSIYEGKLRTYYVGGTHQFSLFTNDVETKELV